MAGYIGKQAVVLSTTAADVNGDITATGDFITDEGKVKAERVEVENDTGPNMYATAYGTGSTTYTWFEGTGDNKLISWGNNGDISFYDDDGSTVKFRWDASTNRLGIGTTTPSQKLNVVDASGSGTATQIASGTTNSQTRFAARTNNYNGIMSLYDSGGTEDVRISADAGIDSYINNGANVGIGTSSPNRELEVTGSGNVYVRVVAPTASDAAGLELVNTGATWLIQNDDGSDDSLTFDRAGSEKLRILSSGGITFNGDTAAANALDDYEEGTWTPGFGGTRALTGGTNSFRYVKVGKQVTVYFSLINATWSGSASGSSLTGLPFNNHGTTRAVGAVQFRNMNLNDSTFNFTAVVAENNSYVFFPQQRDNASWLTMTMADLTAADYLAFTITYEVA